MLAFILAILKIHSGLKDIANFSFSSHFFLLISSQKRRTCDNSKKRCCWSSCWLLFRVSSWK